ncbi:hypothetical protein [Mycobacterium uberis]|uniref:hypothetical protein n=1 Tax=Mycobacterium uberis TaxID=2162698 RepID=UPI0010587DBE|nr:hypothetical protein [Mycobacterium uberis]
MRRMYDYCANLKTVSRTGERVAGVFGYWRENDRFVVFETPAMMLATGGTDKIFKATSNS